MRRYLKGGLECKSLSVKKLHGIRINKKSLIKIFPIFWNLKDYDCSQMLAIGSHPKLVEANRQLHLFL